MKKFTQLMIVSLWIVLFGINSNGLTEVQNQLKVEMEKNLLSISANHVKSKTIIKEIENRADIKIKIFPGVEDKEVTIDVSNIPIYDIGTILNKIGYDNHAVVYNKNEKALDVYVLPKGMDVAAFVKNDPSVVQADFTTSVFGKNHNEPAFIKRKEITTVTRNKIPVKYIKDEVVLKPASYLSDKKIRHTLQKYNLTRMTSPLMEKIGYIKAKVQDGNAVEDVMLNIRKEHFFTASEPNYVLNSLAVSDPLYRHQYYVQETSFDKVWDGIKNGSPVKVAVIDTGVNGDHPDLKGKVLEGYDFFNKNASKHRRSKGEMKLLNAGQGDDNGHGTFVAGIIAASANDIGIRGLFDNARIIPVKVIGEDGFGTYEDTASGIIWAADAGAKVINLSIGGYGYSYMLREAVDYALEKGCVVVAAGGNEGVSEDIYPAAYPDVIGVSALGMDGRIWSGSNKGQYINVCAPGENILSTGTDSSYVYNSGTSASAAMVSGLAAMLFSEKPELSSIYIAELIAKTAIDLGDKGRDNIYGFGVIDAANALVQKVDPFHDAAVRSINIEPMVLEKSKPVNVIANIVNAGTYPLEICDVELYVISANEKKLVERKHVEINGVLSVSFQWNIDELLEDGQFEVKIINDEDVDSSNNIKRSRPFYVKKEDGLVYIKHKSEPNMQVHQFLAGEAWEVIRRYLTGKARVLKIDGNTLNLSNVSVELKDVENNKDELGTDIKNKEIVLLWKNSDNGAINYRYDKMLQEFDEHIGERILYQVGKSLSTEHLETVKENDEILFLHNLNAKAIPDYKDYDDEEDTVNITYSGKFTDEITKYDNEKECVYVSQYARSVPFSIYYSAFQMKAERDTVFETFIKDSFGITPNKPGLTETGEPYSSEDAYEGEEKNDGICCSGEVYEEKFKYVRIGNDDIIEGSHEMDIYDTSEKHDHYNGNGDDFSNFNHHFWQSDSYEDGNFNDGLFGGSSAYVVAEKLWSYAKDLYRAGKKDKAYYYLGRIVHLLEDMGCPPHVHKDPHPGSDTYEDLMGKAYYKDEIKDRKDAKTGKSVYLNWHADVKKKRFKYSSYTDKIEPSEVIEKLSENKPLKIKSIDELENLSGNKAYNEYYYILLREEVSLKEIEEKWANSSGLFKLFFSLAEITDDFPSDDRDGDYVVKGVDKDEKEEIILNSYAPVIQPAIIEHVAGLYLLFWKETHCFIHGKVEDIFGNPIADATVEIYNADDKIDTTATNKDGNFYYETVPQGVLYVNASKEGYQNSKSDFISINFGETKEVSVTLVDSKEPYLFLLYPCLEDICKTSNQLLTVTGTATDKEGVLNKIVVHNKTNETKVEKSITGDTCDFSIPEIELNKGINEICVYAYDSMNNKSEECFLITYDPNYEPGTGGNIITIGGSGSGFGSSQGRVQINSGETNITEAEIITWSDTKIQFDPFQSFEDLIIISVFNSENQEITVFSYPFKDVKPEDWYSEYVAALWKDGVLHGKEDGLFHPEHESTRAEFIKMAVMAAGKECTPLTCPDEPEKYNDIGDHWCYEYVKAAYNAEWLDRSKTEFRPEDYINRAEVATILVRALGKEDYQYSIDSLFEDVQNPDEWYYDPVYIGKSLAVFKGYPDNYFRPGQYINRCEVAAVIYRAFREQPSTNSLGTLYEQKVPDRNIEPPTITLQGNNYAKGGQPFNVSALVDCNRCDPSLLWDTPEGELQQGENSNEVIYTPPTVSERRKLTTTETYMISCTVGDGNGYIAKDYLRVTVASSETPCISISGRITDSSGTPLQSVRMDGLPSTMWTDRNGEYSVCVDEGWSGTARPHKTGFSFTPLTKTYSNVTAIKTSQNYSAEEKIYIIAGQVNAGNNALPGVVMNGLPGNPQTDRNGNYSAAVSFHWTGTVTPHKTGYEFSPSSRTYDINGVYIDERYSAVNQAFEISGRITYNGTGLEGIWMNGLPGGVVTDPNGYYSAFVDYGWSGKVTPVKQGYSFDDMTFNNVTSEKTGQNYSATEQPPESNQIWIVATSDELNHAGDVHQPGDIILVKPGSYNNIDLDGDMENNSALISENGADQTVIQLSRQCRINHSNVKIDGFTFNHETLYIVGANDVQINNCKFDPASLEYGIRIENSQNVLIQGCLFSNTLNGRGGVLLRTGTSGGNITFRNNHFIQNSTGVEGGADGGVQLVFENNLFQNSTDCGIDVGEVNAVIITNNIFINNNRGINLSAISSTPEIIQNTFADNSTAVDLGTSATLYNNIFQGNTRGIDATGSSRTITVHHHMENDTTPFFGDAAYNWDENTIWNDTDPQFVNPSSGDYHLTQGSPAANTGEGGVDLGAYGGSKANAWITPPGVPDDLPALNSIDIDGPDNISPGAAVQLTAKSLHTGGYYSDITKAAQWNSSNSTVLSNQGNGKFSALAPGTSTIIAFYNSKQAQYSVTVLNSGLSINIADSADPIVAGTLLTYIITYSNNGPGIAKDVRIIGNYDSDLTFVSAEPDAGVNNSWTIGDLPSGESGVIKIELRTDDSLAQGVQLISTAAVDSALTDPVQATESTTVDGVSDLFVTLTGTAYSVQPGHQITCTITYGNNGTSTAHNVTITGDYDSNTSFALANPSPDSGNNHWSTGDISPGETGSITIKLAVNSSLDAETVLINHVSILSDNSRTKKSSITTVVSVADNDFTGDINHSGTIDLQDAILGLKVAAGISEKTVHTDADVNEDSKIGIEEVIYLLQVIADIRADNLYTNDTDDDNDGYTENQGDCNDKDNMIYPGAPEKCGDGIDQDCNDADLACEPDCAFIISSTGRSFASTGGTGTVNITAHSSCAWNVTTSQGWITITGSSGNGNETLGYSVSSNLNSSIRTGTITIAEQTFTVTQAGVACAYSISSTSKYFSSSGGTGSVNVTASEGCKWSAASDANWITITSGASGSGNGTASYSVYPNSDASTRTGIIAIAGQALKITQTGVSCTYSLSPASKSFESSGGNGSVNVTAPSGCAWNGTSNSDWITISSGSSGSGNENVAYSIASTADAGSRTGTMTIAGQTFTVTQTGVSCTYSLSPASKSFSSSGGNGSVNVTAPNGCIWNAASNADWITISSGSSGSGNGTVAYSVVPTTDSDSRTGTMTIAGQTFTVTQTGVSCTYSLSSASSSFESSDGNGSVNVTAPNGCTWNAASNADWITISSGSSGSGSGTVTYSVASTADAGSRTGTMSIAGQTFTVTQTGVSCTYSLSSASSSFESSGGNGSVNVTAPNGCTWNAASNADWITISSGSSGSGNGTVAYSVAPTADAGSRTGTMTVAGQTFTVTQTGVSCTYSLSSASSSFESSGGSGSVDITAPNGCTWNASSNADWITVFSGSSGSGNGTVSYSVSSNPDTSNRTGNITIAGKMLTVTQTGMSSTISSSIISGGGSHTIGLKNDGTVWAWGCNGNGMLGDGTTTQRRSPVQVSGLSNVVAVATGEFHSLAIRDDGTLWAWGRNQNGQLGDGTTTQRITPFQVSGLSNVIAVAAGSGHTLALRNDGTVWTWGFNGFGQLGDGTATSKSTPMQVSELSDVKAIAAGLYHSIAIKNDGTVWTWGFNGSGQLGDGTFTNRNAPIQVSGFSNAIAAGGGEHTVVLKDDGTVWAWGSNNSGQLTDGTHKNRNTPVQVSGVFNVIAIATRAYHIVALKDDGTVWIWGDNSHGQLGDGTTTERISPVQMFSSVIAITSGQYYTIAVKDDRTVWGWGYNYCGQLGDGTSNPQSTIPVQVVGPEGIGFFNLTH